MENNSKAQFVSVKVEKKFHDLLMEIKAETGTPISKYIKKAVEAQWAKDHARIKEQQ